MRVNKVQDKPTEDFHGAVMRRVICEDEGAPNFCMRVFEIAPNSSTPLHSHPWEHEVLVLSGQGVAKGEQGEAQVAKDIAVYIPPDEKHCFMNKGSEPLRFV
ncbi:cupin domain-containing protein [Chloroflexota bacterium]